MISIIIPIYNVEAYIENSLRSVFSQTYKDYELILVDDGSRDRSMEVAKGLLESCKFEKYTIITEENSGQGVARNAGMSKAEGEWIYFMDADDLLPPHTLSELLKAAENTSADVTFCGFEFSKGGLIERKKDKSKMKTYSSKEIQRVFLRRKKKILVPGTLYKSKWLRDKKIIFPKLRFSEDIYFLWNAIVKAGRVTEIENCLYTYMVRSNSTMTSSKKFNIEQSYDEFCMLNCAFQKDGRVIGEVKRWMLSRWVLGVMRSSAGVMKWAEYKAFMRQISYKMHCRNLKGFPDFKVALMRNVILCNLRLFYIIASKWNPYI